MFLTGASDELKHLQTSQRHDHIGGHRRGLWASQRLRDPLVLLSKVREPAAS